MSHQALSIRSADRGERTEVALLFATAFTRDPLIAAVTDAARDPHEARVAIFSAAIASTLQAGGALVLAERGTTLVGAALIADPHSGSLWRTLRYAAARVTSAMRFAMIAPRLAPGALTTLNKADLASRNAAPPHPHHHLVAVAVAESARGLGIGTSLVEHTLERARRNQRSRAVRLETENPQNAELYERWGFATLDVVPMKEFDVHVMAHIVTLGDHDEGNRP